MATTATEKANNTGYVILGIFIVIAILGGFYWYFGVYVPKRSMVDQIILKQNIKNPTEPLDRKKLMALDTDTLIGLLNGTIH